MAIENIGRMLWKFLVVMLTLCTGFIPHATHIVMQEQNKYNNILIKHNIPCHSQCSRIKTLPSIIQSLKRKNISNPFEMYDLIAFRYIFYNSEDLYKFYHHVNAMQKVTYCKNYILQPKLNGYRAIHIRYENIYNHPHSSLKHLECQLFLIKDYYDSIYGDAQYTDKPYRELYSKTKEFDI